MYSKVLRQFYLGMHLQMRFWVFIGVVAGAFIQYGLGKLETFSRKKNAIQALQTEIELNLTEYENFKKQISLLRDKVSAAQVNPDDLFINMQGFDYSIVQPLNFSGHFHTMLGSEKVRQYFDFMRYFNINNASFLTEFLRSQHEKGKSIELLNLISDQAEIKSAALKKIITG